MKLIDVNNIDYVSLEDSEHKIEHEKGDEVYCVIAAEVVQAIPLDKVKRAREEMKDKSCYGCLQIMDKLIAESEVE
ncbi:hypothetical protein [Eubacterium oxidoreducens]|uniref:Uncharacterized protein n=1 Tax=Eubacterium oxidoreducens TaxID=1732 RepID=A0A1G6B3T0_EUBOX|nr:hypothetical protein [Eubacterium oxidoreducens]SDB15222.1 hypothetical protein SAMN02910417_01127 [Eubacterium oxidoreducens]